MKDTNVRLDVGDLKSCLVQASSGNYPILPGAFFAYRPWATLCDHLVASEPFKKLFALYIDEVYRKNYAVASV